MRDIKIEALYTAPGKALALNELEVMTLGPTGPIGDRQFAVVGQDGRCLTQRTHPRLVLVEAWYPWPDPLGGVVLSVEAEPGFSPFFFEPNLKGAVKPIRVVPSAPPARGIDQGDRVADWFTDFLNTGHVDEPIRCRVVWIPSDNTRLVKPPFTQVPISLVDGFPILVTGRASHQYVCERLRQGFLERRWRPGVVIDGLKPFEEDEILEVVVGRGVKLIFEKLNARCTVIKVNPCNGVPDFDLLEQLAEFRRLPEPTTGALGVMFGVNVRAVFQGPTAHIHRGDRIRIVKKRPRRTVATA
jgi:uncharacterized protein